MIPHNYGADCRLSTGRDSYFHENLLSRTGAWQAAISSDSSRSRSLRWEPNRQYAPRASTFSVGAVSDVDTGWPPELAATGAAQFPARVVSVLVGAAGENRGRGSRSRHPPGRDRCQVSARPRDKSPSSGRGTGGCRPGPRKSCESRPRHRAPRHPARRLRRSQQPEPWGRPLHP